MLFRSFSKQGLVAVLTGTTRYYFDDSRTITKIRASLGTVATGSSVIVALKLNGSTTVGTVTIAASSFTSTTTVSQSVVSGDYITIDTTQVGSTFAGADLIVTLSVS